MSLEVGLCQASPSQNDTKAQSIQSQSPPPPYPTRSEDSEDSEDTNEIPVGERRVSVSSLGRPRSAASRIESADTATIPREPGCDDVGTVDELPVDLTLEDAPF